MMRDMMAGAENAMRYGTEAVAMRFPGYEIEAHAYRWDMAMAVFKGEVRLSTGEVLRFEVTMEELYCTSHPWNLIAQRMLDRVAQYVKWEIITLRQGEEREH